MAIYKRGYQRYQGPYTPHLTRLLAFPRFSWRRLVNQRLVVIMLMASLFWPLACGAFVYISNHTELLQGLGGPLVNFLNINGTFFLTFMGAQSFFAIVLAALAGPGLVAPDLANNALPLYFSRPLSRLDYVLARLLVLAAHTAFQEGSVPCSSAFTALGFTAKWKYGPALRSGAMKTSTHSPPYTLPSCLSPVICTCCMSGWVQSKPMYSPSCVAIRRALVCVLAVAPE